MDHEAPKQEEPGFWDKVFESNGALSGLHTGLHALQDAHHMLKPVEWMKSLPGGADNVGMFGAVLSPFSIASGIHEIKKGHKAGGPDGVLDMIGGGGEILEGAANLMPLLGYETPFGLAAGTFNQAFKTTRAGDEGFKGHLGKDEKGHDRSFTDWSADRAALHDQQVRHKTYQALTKGLGMGERASDIISSTAGTVVGGGETLLNTLGGAVACPAMGLWSRAKSLFSGDEEHH